MSLSAKQLGITPRGGRLVRYTEEGGDNAALNAVLAAPGANWRLVFASVSYSGAPTQAGATIKLDSGAGEAFDTVIRTGAANEQYTNFPDVTEGPGTPDLTFGADDGLEIAAPAGGLGVAAAVAIYIEIL